LARLLSTLLVVGLLGGTAAAFAVTEGLKLEKSPILSTRVSKVFSPVCKCDKQRAEIAFRIRKSDRVSVEIVQGDTVVRHLVDRRYRRGRLHFTWNGRDDAGNRVPDGTYQPRVHLAGEHRTILMPNPITIDTLAPHVTRMVIGRPVLSPDGDGRGDSVVIAYRLNGPAHAILLVNGKVAVRTKFKQAAGQLRWYGREKRRALPAGTYRVAVAAEDAAGNVGPETAPHFVVIRYIDLTRKLVRVAAGERFGIGVRTDARAFRWKLGKRSSVARRHFLRILAPKQPGQYTLTVSEHGHHARAAVIVRKAKAQ
jgi:hypothetical protein